MTQRIALIGLDEPESNVIRERGPDGIVAYESLPRIRVQDAQLWLETKMGGTYHRIDRIVFHGIFEHDFDFLAALVLWGGPCYPEPQPMLDCRLRLPCLARALKYTRFGAPARDYVGPNVEYIAESEHVAKWGNWHCGENKTRFSGGWVSAEPCLIEPFIVGEAVRVIGIGNRYWQIRMTGSGWLKSVHDDGATFMELDAELLADTKAIRQGFGLSIIANDYMVSENGTKHQLEVNHIPSVTCFPELWEAYRDVVLEWLM